MDSLLSDVFYLATLLVTVLLFALVIRRLLGVRMSWLRTLVAAVLALFIVEPLTRTILPDPRTAQPGTQVLVLLLGASSASLLAMALLVIAEVLVPERSMSGPLQLWRDWRARLSRTRRYSQILGIAIRHGLGPFLRGRRHPGLESPTTRRQLAQSLRLALDEGGVTFTKLGQQLSTRRDLLAPEFVSQLTALQDAATPVAWNEIRTVLDQELGRPVEEIFTEFAREPMAAASIAQVHAAQLPDGRHVVVKVQRPRIAQVVDRDLDILARLARMLERRTDWGRSLGVRALADGFSEALHEELDFTVERDNLRAVDATLDRSRRPSVRVPVPYPELCSPRVLVMEHLDGVPLGASDRVLAALDEPGRAAAADALLGTVLDQVLVHGLFHVDLHPGNVLISEDGSIGMLDLGSVGRLDASTRGAVARLMAALGRGDSLVATDGLLELVDRPDQLDERALERVLGGVIVRHVSAGSSEGSAMFAALFRMLTSHRLGVPPQVAAMFRAFATLEGTLTIIDPAFDTVERAKELGRARASEALDPPRLRQALEDEVASMLPLLRRLPRRVDRVADAVERGRLTANVRLFGDRRERLLVIDLLHQFLLTLIGIAAGIMAVLLLDNDAGPAVSEDVRLFPMLGYSLLVVAVVLILRVLVVIFRQVPTSAWRAGADDVGS